MAENKIKNPIKVERETFEMDDKQYFSYFIKGTVRGKDVKVAIVHPDKGGYVVLDIVFDGAMEAELVVIPYEMKDDNGKTIKGNTYAVRSYDDDGTVYECKVKPFRYSDKNILDMLLR